MASRHKRQHSPVPERSTAQGVKGPEDLPSRGRETHGHLTRDGVLAEMARRRLACARPTDTVAGVLRRVPRPARRADRSLHAKLIARRILGALREPIRVLPATPSTRGPASASPSAQTPPTRSPDLHRTPMGGCTRPHGRADTERSPQHQPLLTSWPTWSEIAKPLSRTTPAESRPRWPGSARRRQVRAVCPVGAGSVEVRRWPPRRSERRLRTVRIPAGPGSGPAASTAGRLDDAYPKAMDARGRPVRPTARPILTCAYAPFQRTGPAASAEAWDLVGPAPSERPAAGRGEPGWPGQITSGTRWARKICRLPGASCRRRVRVTGTWCPSRCTAGT